ncbi:unnamed protein product [Caenorhabditis auriculariae]|uniref:TM2 domain-containing protein n=1 Tax=Caenorhabditis auriculariae TaxID=2777116 RepID=A0A8S1HTJ6_9PELO|nr:unnamed protein product [Caenorhabditis auriculariae]
MGFQDDDDDVKPWKARLLLVFGGFFGAHRLYLRQIPEAFVFFSTFGVFLLGVLYDSFYLNSEVSRVNLSKEDDSPLLKEKFKNGKLLAAQSKFVSFSFSRLIFSILYGCWIGFLAWLACSVTLGWTKFDHLLFVVIISAAISAGIYVVGQCGGQSRELLYIWLTASSVSFLLVKVLGLDTLRMILLTSIAATLIGNRTARFRGFRQRHSYKKFFFWGSLFALLICIIMMGCTRKIMDRKVTATHPGKSRAISSIGSLLHDRFFDKKHVYSFFKNDPFIEYQAYTTTDSHRKKSLSDEEQSVSSKRPLISSKWWRVWSSDFWDELTSAATSRRIDWVEKAAVVIVDVLRAETRVRDGRLNAEPLKWAAYRMFLIHKFDLPPFVQDDRVTRECQFWLKTHKNRQKIEKDGRDFAAIATRSACLTRIYANARASVQDQAITRNVKKTPDDRLQYP